MPSLHSQALVSIIIPIYNAAPYLVRTWDSLSSQTYTQLEIILIDDGSGDDSLDICRDIAMQDGRVKVLHHENQGASFTRNRGIEEAAGDYIMFVDADDALSPYSVEALLKAAQKHHADITVGDVSVLYSNESPDWREPDINNSCWIPSDQAYNRLARYEWWGPVAKLYKALFIKQFRFPKETLSEDYFLMVQMFHQASICHQPGTIYAYHKREGSLSTATDIALRSLDELHNTYNAWLYTKEYIPAFSGYALHFYTESCVKVALRAARAEPSVDEIWKVSQMGIKKNLHRIFFNSRTHFKLKIICLLIFLGKSACRLIQNYIE